MSTPIQPEHWIAVEQSLPKENQPVLILVADPAVAIEARPAVAHLQIEFRGTPGRRLDWWTGLPGSWKRLPADGWTVTHWMPMPTWRDGHWMTRGSCLGMEGPDAPSDTAPADPQVRDLLAKNSLLVQERDEARRLARALKSGDASPEEVQAAAAWLDEGDEDENADDFDSEQDVDGEPDGVLTLQATATTGEPLGDGLSVSTHEHLRDLYEDSRPQVAAMSGAAAGKSTWCPPVLTIQATATSGPLPEGGSVTVDPQATVSVSVVALDGREMRPPAPAAPTHGAGGEFKPVTFHVDPSSPYAWTGLAAMLENHAVVVVHGANGAGMMELADAFYAGPRGGTIWRMPEAGLDSVALMGLVKDAVANATPDRPLVIVTHSLFVMREVLLTEQPVCWVGLHPAPIGGVTAMVGADIADTGDVLALDAELAQAERYMDWVMRRGNKGGPA